ncbi:MAG: peptidoglycan editing factor PgeF [Blastocatellales bacterium]|nr:peptidoglycan editing factor PgeF [Blastocatellales bacterium]
MPTTMRDFIFRERDGLTLIVVPPLESAGFRHAFSTRPGGVSPLPEGSLSLGNFRQDERSNVVENRRRFLSALDAADWTLVTARQIHSADVRAISDIRDAQADPAECDALTAHTPHIMLGVQTADCVPALVADPRTGAFAAVHAGWRGTLAGILARTVESMQLEWDSRPEDLLVALGPAAAGCCLEVGPEVVAAFGKRYEYTDELLSRRQASGKANLDLHRANARQALDSGVSVEHIYSSDLCTICRDDLFFSYRRERGAERPVGRLMGVIGRDSQSRNS